MKQYKGYYIDHAVFNSKEDIDTFIKANLIKKVAMLNKMMRNYTDPGMMMAACAEMTNIERVLMSEYGMTAAEIEEIELAA